MAARKKIKKSKSVKSKVAVKVAPRKKGVARREHGPANWFLPTVESAYTQLKPRDTQEAPAASVKSAKRSAKPVRAKSAFTSALQPERGQDVLEVVDNNLWRDRLAEYKKRKAAAAARPLAQLATRIAPPAPAVAGATNWAPLGPSVVMNGQAQGEPPIAGRIPGVAVASGGLIVYAASANGGVFRSDDGGVSWKALMDGFDLAPTEFASTSLACGAIAIDPKDPDRVYVGTGEGDTYSMFKNRLVNALPAYRGVGPIRSDDGGATWKAEETATGSPDLAGQAFFALAVDTGNRENVVGATSQGLYQRVAGAIEPRMPPFFMPRLDSNTINLLAQWIGSLTSGQPIRLAITPDLNVPQLNLSWRSNALSFDLYTTTDLVTPIMWSIATNPAALSNGQWMITIPAENRGKFFRLQSR